VIGQIAGTESWLNIVLISIGLVIGALRGIAIVGSELSNSVAKARVEHTAARKYRNQTDDEQDLLTNVRRARHRMMNARTPQQQQRARYLYNQLTQTRPPPLSGEQVLPQKG